MTIGQKRLSTTRRRLLGAMLFVAACGGESTSVPTLEVVTESLPSGSPGIDYGTETLEATGGDGSYTWTLAESSASLPDSLALSEEGEITGTPHTPGTFLPTVEVTSGDGQVAQKVVSIQVLDTLKIETSSLPEGSPSVTYGHDIVELTATGGREPYMWRLATTSGPLPGGLSLSSGGRITGTPNDPGTFTFTAEVRSPDGQVGQRELEITVLPFVGITTVELPDMPPDLDNFASLAAEGGRAPYQWGLATGSGPLPDGLLLSTSGEITGAPTAEGTFDFTVEVTSEDGQEAQRMLSIAVATVTVDSMRWNPFCMFGDSIHVDLAGVNGCIDLRVVTWPEGSSRRVRLEVRNLAGSLGGEYDTAPYFDLEGFGIDLGRGDPAAEPVVTRTVGNVGQVGMPVFPPQPGFTALAQSTTAVSSIDGCLPSARGSDTFTTCDAQGYNGYVRVDFRVADGAWSLADAEPIMDVVTDTRGVFCTPVSTGCGVP